MKWVAFRIVYCKYDSTKFSSTWRFASRYQHLLNLRVNGGGVHESA